MRCVHSRHCNAMIVLFLENTGCFEFLSFDGTQPFSFFSFPGLHARSVCLVCQKKWIILGFAGLTLRVGSFEIIPTKCMMGKNMGFYFKIIFHTYHTQDFQILNFNNRQKNNLAIMNFHGITSQASTNSRN